MSLYDAVVLATGAERDRLLAIPGEDLPGVLGSGAFTGWYNGHPDRRASQVHDVCSAVIIGNGNVAIDVARVLAKGPSELAGSDLSPQVTAWLEAQPIEMIHVVGRRSAAEAKFTAHELAELGTLAARQTCRGRTRRSGGRECRGCNATPLRYRGPPVRGDD